MACKASALFGRKIESRLVFEREWPLEFGVAAHADVGAVVRQLSTRQIQAHMAFAALDDAVVHRVPVGPGELTLDLRVAGVAELRLFILEKRGVLVAGVDAVAAAAIDPIASVDVPFEHVLLMRTLVTGPTQLGLGSEGKFRGIGHPIFLWILFPMHAVAAVTVRARDARGGHFPFDIQGMRGPRKRGVLIRVAIEAHGALAELFLCRGFGVLRGQNRTERQAHKQAQRQVPV
jgi:hypothetical protein